MNFLEKIKNGEQKKIIENSVIFLMLFVIIIIVMNTLNVPEEKVTISTQTDVETRTEIGSYDDTEEKLKKILSLIDGVGRVEVMISYLNGMEQIPMYDERISTTITEESDKEGGKRQTKQTNNEHNIIFEEKNNTKTAIVKQTIMPEAIGVIIVADGAGDLRVKESIIKAVEATVNVPAHRIQVFARITS